MVTARIINPGGPQQEKTKPPRSTPQCVGLDAQDTSMWEGGVLHTVPWGEAKLRAIFASASGLPGLSVNPHSGLAPKVSELSPINMVVPRKSPWAQVTAQVEPSVPKEPTFFPLWPVLAP